MLVRWISMGPGNGYGNAAEAYRTGLRAAGIPVSWTPVFWSPHPREAESGPPFHRDIDDVAGGDLARGIVEPDTVVVHSTPFWPKLAAARSPGSLLAAYTTWETDRLPEDRVATLNRYDRVLVPSRFNAGVFRFSGVTVPVWVVPHIAPAAEVRAREPGGTRFVFYLIATWTTRKAIRDAVEAFLMAFAAQDDVALVIHTTPVDLVARKRAELRHSSSLSLARALAGHRNVPDIVLSTRRLTQAEVDGLHLRGDCFLCLSRGEGWGLGAFEAAAFGNPVVVTGWGAAREFLPEDYPYLVDYDLIPTTDDEPDEWWQPREGERWAKARIPHAAALLRHLYSHREEARSWGRAAQAHVLENFGSARVTGRLLEALSADRVLTREGHQGGGGGTRPR